MADPLRPEERLRALELTGDPDAQQIARKFKDSPLSSTRSAMRAVRRQFQQPARMLQPNYGRATDEDADEAEQEYAAVRGEREQKARERDSRLFEMAEAGSTREKEMLNLTRASVAVSGISFLVALAALIVAFAAGGCP